MPLFQHPIHCQLHKGKQVFLVIHCVSFQACYLNLGIRCSVGRGGKLRCFIEGIFLNKPGFWVTFFPGKSRRNTLCFFPGSFFRKPSFLASRCFLRGVSEPYYGFHRLLCRDETFHDPTDSCVCDLCERQCERYNIERCTKRTKSICEYATQGRKT